MPENYGIPSLPPRAPSSNACHCEPVTDVTGVAPSGDSLRSQSPGRSGSYRRSAKAPLADQGWCSAQRIKIEMIASGSHTIICAAPVRTLGLRGSELSRSDNPSVMALRETAMTAPFTQGSLWVLPHQCVCRLFNAICYPTSPGKSVLSFAEISCLGRNHQIHPPNSIGNDVFCVGAVKSRHTRQKEVAFGA